MEMSVGEHATDSSQPCRKGAIRGNITALEEANGEIPVKRRKRSNSSPVAPNTAQLHDDRAIRGSLRILSLFQSIGVDRGAR